MAPAQPGCWNPGLRDTGLTPGAHLCEASLPKWFSRAGTSGPDTPSPQEVLEEHPLSAVPEGGQRCRGRCTASAQAGSADTLVWGGFTFTLAFDQVSASVFVFNCSHSQLPQI